MNDKTHKTLALLLDYRKMSQADLARATGLNQPTISRMLTPGSPKGIKSPSDKQVRPIAQFFGVTADQLRGYQDLDIEGVMILAEPSVKAFAGKEIDDPIAWLQMIREVQSPELLESLKNIVLMFSKGSLTPADAQALEEITRRFFQSAPKKRLSKGL